MGFNETKDMYRVFYELKTDAGVKICEAFFETKEAAMLFCKTWMDANDSFASMNEWRWRIQCEK